MTAFDPTDGIRFPTFEQEMKLFREKYIPQYRRLRELGLTHRRAMSDAFIHSHNEFFPFLPGIGDQRHYRLQHDALRYLQDLLQKAIDYLGRYNELDIVSEADCTDPEILLSMCLEEPSEDAGSRAHRRYRESLRAMVISHQLMIMDFMDPALEISQDLGAINKIAKDVLFTDDELMLIHVVAKLDVDDKMRVIGMREAPYDPDLRIFPEHLAAEQHMRQLRSDGISFHHMELLCRSVRKNGTTWFIWDTSRPKLRSSCLLKCYRRSHVNDARGMRMTVVATQTEDEVMRVALRTDVVEFWRYVKGVFWRGGLLRVGDTVTHRDKEASQHSHRRFWDQKIDGEFLAERAGGRTEIRPVEQQFTSIGDAISQITVRGDENGIFYNGRRVLDHLAEPWFGHILKFSDPEIRHEIQRHWYDKLPRITYVPEDIRRILAERRNSCWEGTNS